MAKTVCVSRRAERPLVVSYECETLRGIPFDFTAKRYERIASVIECHCCLCGECFLPVSEGHVLTVRVLSLDFLLSSCESVRFLSKFLLGSSYFK